MYKLLRPLLFLIDPERIHHLTFSVLRGLGRIPGFTAVCALMFRYEDQSLAVTAFGLRFKNRVGLAAGFDKDAALIDELACFGFGCIEIGTLTPLPQPGNEKPRLFRLPADSGLINRMGFNNGGVHAAAARLKKRKSSVLVGGNIGKNKLTPNEHAADDYRLAVEALHEYVDYFVVNVSSPNTPGLRELQDREPLTRLLTAVKQLARSKPTARPVLLKIAPDLSNDQLDDVISILKETQTDGVIATNTTVSRAGLVATEATLTEIGAGGLSGKPLADRSNAVIAHLRKGLGPDYPIIGVGGIMSPEDSLAKITAGATLLQLYTGFIYEGPGIVRRINRFLRQNLRVS